MNCYMLKKNYPLRLPGYSFKRIMILLLSFTFFISLKNTVYAQVKTTIIKGQVIAAGGGTITDVSILIKGNKAGTKTDADGKFEITVPTGSVLIISHIGFITQEISTKGISTVIAVQ